MQENQNERAPEERHELFTEESKTTAELQSMTAYTFFLQSQQNHWETIAKAEHSGLRGRELTHMVNKLAFQSWSNLSNEEKQSWKKKLRSPQKTNDIASDIQKLVASVVDQANQGNAPTLYRDKAKATQFANVDTRGFSDLRHLVQKLVESLICVGSVLDRHRESLFAQKIGRHATVDSDLLRDLVPSPIKIMSDGEVVSWLWADHRGVVANLLAMVEQRFPECSLLRELISSTMDGYPVLSAFAQNYATASLDKKWKHSCTSSDARRLVTSALMKFRSNIIDFLAFAEKSHTRERKERRRRQARAREMKKKQQNAKAVGGRAFNSGLVPGSTSGCEGLADNTSENEDDDDESSHDSDELAFLPTSTEEDEGATGDDESSDNSDESDDDDDSQSSTGDEAMVIRGGGGACVSGDPPENDLLDSLVQHQPQLPLNNHVSMSDAEGKPKAIRPSVGETHQPTYNCASHSKTQAEVGHSSRPQPNVSTSNQNDILERHSESGLPSNHAGDNVISSPTSPERTGNRSDAPQEPTRAEMKTRKSKKKVPLSEDQVKYLKDWLFDPKHILNPYPTDKEKSTMMEDIGIERKRLDGWFMKNRQRVLYPKIRPVKMVWKARDEEHWAEFRTDRYMLQATADLLLIYANTNIFFLSETQEAERVSTVFKTVESVGVPVAKKMMNTFVTEEADRKEDGAVKKCFPLEGADCSGEDVLSQLLQWDIGDIGDKKGIFEMHGCLVLPSITGCWDNLKCREVKLPDYTRWNSRTITEYDANARLELVNWIADCCHRGNPWNEELTKFFCSSDADPVDPATPMGSPVLDYLVTGQSGSARLIYEALSGHSSDNSDGIHDYKDIAVKPVASWVQCENPKCLKWRKLPWHVDSDLLAENFICTDNIWNPHLQCCSAPEEEWDVEDQHVFDTSAESFTVGGKLFVIVLFDCDNMPMMKSFFSFCSMV